MQPTTPSGAVAVLLLALAIPAVAQPAPRTEPATFQMTKEYRAIQLRALETQRTLLLSMADSMPERLYDDRATPIQRTFAEQLHHIARSSGFVATFWLTGKPRPQTADDSTRAIADRAGLRAYINGEYDYLVGLMKSQTDEDRDLRVQFVRGAVLPKWQVWDELNQHAMWTAGQIVANFRKHGMAPPAFLFF